MGKALENFRGILQATSKLASKFTATKAYTRIAPAFSKDPEAQMHIQGGYHDEEGKKLHVSLNINNNAKDEALKKFVKKNKGDSKIATEVFNLAAKDKEEETQRVVDSLTDQAEDALG